jgi:hypothetical protein
MAVVILGAARFGAEVSVAGAVCGDLSVASPRDLRLVPAAAIGDVTEL